MTRELGLSKAARCLAAYRKTVTARVVSAHHVLRLAQQGRQVKLSRSVALLERSRPVCESLATRRQRFLSSALKVLTAFREAGGRRYDIFRIAGFWPDENSLSDAIASLLNPTEPHGLGFAPLRSLLALTRQKRPEVVGEVPEDDEWTSLPVHVYRERDEGLTRPDIEIITPRFLIFIENKMRGGAETVTRHGSQTERQWEALQKKGAKLGLDEKARIGVYLTPEGKPAASPHFVSVTVDEVVEVIQRAVEESGGTTGQGHVAAVRAFLGFLRSHRT